MPMHTMGFYGTTAQPASANQAQVTTTVGAALATTAATNSSPYGFSQAQADGLIARVNALRVDVLALTVLVNQLQADLVTNGFIKGSA